MLKEGRKEHWSGSAAALFSLWGPWPLSGCFQVTVPFPLLLLCSASAWTPPPAPQHPDLGPQLLTPSLSWGGFDLRSHPGAGIGVREPCGLGMCSALPGGGGSANGLSPHSLGEQDRRESVPESVPVAEWDEEHGLSLVLVGAGTAGTAPAAATCPAAPALSSLPALGQACGGSSIPLAMPTARINRKCLPAWQLRHKSRIEPLFPTLAASTKSGASCSAI